MRILDKYIIREYLKIFLVIAFSFSVLFLIVDISDRLPRLLNRGASWQNLTLYFILRVPYLMVLSSPVMVLLSGLFLMNNLAKHSESVAIRAAGISVFRMVSPLLIFGIFFSVGILLFGEYVLPSAEFHRKVIYKERIKNQKIEDKMARSHIYYVGKDNNLYYIGYFDGYRGQLSTIDITKYFPDSGIIRKKITASKAVWEDDKWVFKNCYIRTFDGDRMQKSDFYENVKVWYNKQIDNPHRKKKTLDDIKKDFFVPYKIKDLEFNEQEIDFNGQEDLQRLNLPEKGLRTISLKFKDIEKHIFRKAINIKAKQENSLFQFEKLKEEFKVEDTLLMDVLEELKENGEIYEPRAGEYKIL